jgi:hypothetical protein
MELGAVYGDCVWLAALMEFQTGGLVCLEGNDGLKVIAQQAFDQISRPVATPEPNHLGRRPGEGRPFSKITIQRNEREIIGASMSPNSEVIGLGKTAKTHLARARKQVVQPRAQFEAQILIKEKLHTLVRSRLSRSAA